MEQLKISYKIYMEAEDIGQSRIHTSIAFVKNQFARSRSVYLQSAAFDDESDLDAFTLRFYVENEVCEEDCTSLEDAQSFVLDLAQVLWIWKGNFPGAFRERKKHIRSGLRADGITVILKRCD